MRTLRVILVSLIVLTLAPGALADESVHEPAPCVLIENPGTLPPAHIDPENCGPDLQALCHHVQRVCDA